VRTRVEAQLVYPAAARRARLEGGVALLFTVAADGSVHELRVEKSSGFSVLDAAAAAAVVRAAPFPPLDRDRRFTLPISFHLEN
jgi:protein TonB